MRDDLIDHAHAIIGCGLSLRDRLEAGECLAPDAERERLLALVTRLDAEEAGSAEMTKGHDRSRLSRAAIRCVLASWLDEYLLQYSAWGERWLDFALEPALYAGSRPGQPFWEEAERAEQRGDRVALEVMYWCVMLGFRGAWRNKPDEVESWAIRVRGLLEKSAFPVERIASPWNLSDGPAEPATEKPMRQMRFAALLTFSCLGPLVLLILWRLHGT